MMVAPKGGIAAAMPAVQQHRPTKIWGISRNLFNG